MQAEDWLGWGASAILLATLLRQVFVQWRERRTDGVSSWLFIGQISASVGFVIYSWLVGNRVFVVTNTALLLAIVVADAADTVRRRWRR